ncbi:hypothetical protein C8R45DRAFT_946444 [Mycena sanguinolenta]|nr:hypothetical protein C8R45DRAFT_946444 [Mycena sanguinolenta]
MPFFFEFERAPLLPALGLVVLALLPIQIRIRRKEGGRQEGRTSAWKYTHTRAARPTLQSNRIKGTDRQHASPSEYRISITIHPSIQLGPTATLRARPHSARRRQWIRAPETQTDQVQPPPTPALPTLAALTAPAALDLRGHGAGPSRLWKSRQEATSVRTGTLDADRGEVEARDARHPRRRQGLRRP